MVWVDEPTGMALAAAEVVVVPEGLPCAAADAGVADGAAAPELPLPQAAITIAIENTSAAARKARRR